MHAIVAVMAVSALLSVAATTEALVLDGPSPPASPLVPCASPVAASPDPSAAPASGIDVALQPTDDLPGERMYTIGDTALVEEVVALEVLEAWRHGAHDATTLEPRLSTYTFLVQFGWDGTPREFLDMTGGYYNAGGFSLRDDESFEYPVLHSGPDVRQPALLFGEVAEGQIVKGWVTFRAPSDATFVELTYSPIADERVFFRVAAPQC